MLTKTSPPALVFEKVLRAFETGGFTYTDVVAQLMRLLASGASPTELLEILRREELSEPLPEHMRVKVFGILDDAIARVAAQAAVSDQVKNSDRGTAPNQTADSTPAPTRSATTALPAQQAESPVKTTPVALTSVFEKALNAIDTRDFTDADVLAELQRLLLGTGDSPTALLEILRRRKLIEQLPENAYAEVLGLLNDAMGRAGVLAESDEALNAEPVTATRQSPDSVPAPTRSTPMPPSLERTKRAAKASVVMTSLRNLDLTSVATPNRATTDSAPPTTPIQIATPKQAARPVSSRIPATSPEKPPGLTPTVTPGPILVIGPSRSPTEGPPAAVTPIRSLPPKAVPAKSGTPTPAPAQATMSSSPSASTSILIPAMEQTAGLTPTRTLPPDSAPG